MSVVKNYQPPSSGVGGGIQSLSVTDTDSVDLTISGSDDLTLQADVKISASEGNSIQINEDGLYAPTPSAGISSVSGTDTDSIDITVTTTDGSVDVEAALVVSPDAGNSLEVRANGAFVPPFSQNVVVDFYDTPGAFTWTKPAGSVYHEIYLIGGGGGGASGFVRSPGNNSTGGGGGAGGCIVRLNCLTQFLASSVSGSVGDGGDGGAPRTSGTGNGNPGSAGQNTTFGSFTAQGGNAGPISSDASGKANACILYETTFNSSDGGGVNTGNGQTPSQMQRQTPTGGGSGGSPVGSDPANFGIGGRGGAFLTFALIGYPTSGALGGQTAGAPGTDGFTTGIVGVGGGGGAGGSVDGTVDGGNGGNGGAYGGGGGGGGGATTPAASGSGGKGGKGCVIVVSYVQ